MAEEHSSDHSLPGGDGHEPPPRAAAHREDAAEAEAEAAPSSSSPAGPDLPAPGPGGSSDAAVQEANESLATRMSPSLDAVSTAGGGSDGVGSPPPPPPPRPAPPTPGGAHDDASTTTTEGGPPHDTAARARATTTQEEAGAAASSASAAAVSSASEIGRLGASLKAAKVREMRLESEKQTLELSLKNLREKFVSSTREQQATFDGQMEQITADSLALESKLASAVEDAGKERSLRLDAEVQLCEATEELDATGKRLQEAQELIQEVEADSAMQGSNASTMDEEMKVEKALRIEAECELEAVKESLASLRVSHDALLGDTGMQLEAAQHDAQKAKAESKTERELRLEAEESLETATGEVGALRARVQELEQAAKGKNREHAEVARKLGEVEVKLHAVGNVSSESEVAVAKMEAMLKARDQELDGERQKRRASEEKSAGLEATVMAKSKQLDTAAKSVGDSQALVDGARRQLDELEAIKSENFHLHSILKLKGEAGLRAEVLEAKGCLAKAEREREEARGQLSEMKKAAASLGKSAPANDQIVGKMMARVNELESENRGLSQYVDKLIQDLMQARDPDN